MDNLSSHKGGKGHELLEERGCKLLYLPPYSPDLNPIEEAFSKVKRLLREAEVRTHEAVVETIGRALSAVTLPRTLSATSSTVATRRQIDRCSACSFCVPDGPLLP